MAHVKLFIHQYPQVLLGPCIPQSVLLEGVAPTHVQDLALGLVEPQTQFSSLSRSLWMASCPSGMSLHHSAWCHL